MTGKFLQVLKKVSAFVGVGLRRKMWSLEELYF